MSNKISTAKLQGVPETLLIPLYARAIETQRPDGLIRDTHAVDMITRIDYDFEKFADAPASMLGVAIRTEIFDELAAAFLQKYPDAVVVNIAAGLDTRFFRLDNGRVRWYELDLPESIEMRRQFIPDSQRHTAIAASVLDFMWMEKIERREHTLFIVEGLFMYFEEADVKRVVLALAEHFPGAEIIMEVIGVSQARETRSDMVTKTNARFKWGIREAKTIADWDARLHYISDVSVYDRYENRWLELPLNWPVSPPNLRNTVDRMVHLQFAR